MPVTTSNHHHNSTEGVLMIINTNMGSSTAARILAENTSALQKSLKRLSTGSKIASVSDDAAGLAVASKLGAQMNRIAASKDNVGNLLSFSQTQEGYINQINSALTRMSELAMLATDATKSSGDLLLYDAEFQELGEFLDSVRGKDFNGLSLFSATSKTATLDIGVSVTLENSNLSTAVYNTAFTGSAISTAASAAASLTNIQAAITALAADQAKVGANMSRLENEFSALAVLKDNLGAARSRIIDVDVAEESANFARQQILVQSGTAMLAQANILPQSALRLIS
jgi:flagellin